MSTVIGQTKEHRLKVLNAAAINLRAWLKQVFIMLITIKIKSLILLVYILLIIFLIIKMFRFDFISQFIIHLIILHLTALENFLLLNVGFRCVILKMFVTL